MKILLAVDDSPHSWAAVGQVKRMPWPSNTRIIVLSVAQPMYAMAEMGGGGYIASLEADEERRHQELAAQVERDLKSAGFETSARSEHGDPRLHIVDMARAEHADLVVVGSHGRTGFGKLLMGSVSSHVVAHAPCTVLVVKLPAQS